MISFTAVSTTSTTTSLIQQFPQAHVQRGQKPGFHKRGTRHTRYDRRRRTEARGSQAADDDDAPAAAGRSILFPTSNKAATMPCRCRGGTLASLWCGYMSTEFAHVRLFTPHLRRQTWETFLSGTGENQQRQCSWQLGHMPL